MKEWANEITVREKNKRKVRRWLTSGIERIWGKRKKTKERWKQRTIIPYCRQIWARRGTPIRQRVQPSGLQTENGMAADPSVANQWPNRVRVSAARVTDGRYPGVISWEYPQSAAQCIIDMASSWLTLYARWYRYHQKHSAANNGRKILLHHALSRPYSVLLKKINQLRLLPKKGLATLKSRRLISYCRW